jgi:glycerophosphoryl diester phosphodiesterase
MGPELPFVIAHRGASGSAPENTLVAVRRARDLGARWAEVDVQCAADGTPVVIHDHRLDRTTDAKGLVAERTATALAQCDAGSWFGAAFVGEPVPTLDEMLRCCADLDMGLNVELKPPSGSEVEVAEAVAARLAQWPRPVLVSCFSLAALIGFHKAAPGVALGALFRDAPSPADVRALGIPVHSVNVRARGLAEPQVVALRAAGHRVLVYTVNDPNDAQRFRCWGITGVFTDYPERLLRHFRD